ncbi:MAG: threonine/serine dehydratase [Hyphomicrobiaceae bacterium]
MDAQEISRDAIAAAYNRIRPHVRKTPIIESASADFGIDAGQLTFKLEHLQHAGSFKSRGAFTNLLLRDIPKAGVAAASGGNHGAAVAYAASKLGRKATIFVPKISSAAKIQRIRDFGADLVVEGERYVDALAKCEEYMKKSGALGIHAYDQPETLLGQGTVGLELEAQAPKIDTLLVSVGGGGLIGGIAAWYEGRIRIVGVEPATSNALFAALAAQTPVDVEVSGVAADSLGARRVGSLMFPLARAYVDQVVLVGDDAIRAAQLSLWQGMRQVLEPGGAAAFAALLSGAYRPAKGEKVGVLLCGANTSAVDFGK